MATKPVTRKLLYNSARINFVISIGAAFVLGAAYRFGVQNPRRKAFEDFHKTYDPDAAYERMRRAGVFQTVNQKIEEGTLSK